MKYAVQMGSDGMIYVSSFIKIRSGFSNLIVGYRGIQTAWISHKPTLIFFFKMRKVG
jgi:hypothetical protein